MNAPHTESGKTKLVPVKIWHNGKEIESKDWDEVLWIERGEDWYALSNSRMMKNIIGMRFNEVIETDLAKYNIEYADLKGQCMCRVDNSR